MPNPVARASKDRGQSSATTVVKKGDWSPGENRVRG